MAGLNCRYCKHPVDGAVCTHCGAPAPAAAPDPAPVATAVPEAGVSREARGSGPNAKKVAESAVGFVRSRWVPEAEEVVRKGHPAWQWKLAGGVLLVALLLLGFLMIRSCSLPTAPGGFTNPGLSGGPAATLPGSLASASCEPRDPATGVERCVVPAGDPLLSGELTGGRALVLRVQVVASADLAQTVKQWRSAGGTVVSDGPVFASINASSAVLYADTESGLRIDTGSFANKTAAQTFLSRSGLLG